MTFKSEIIKTDGIWEVHLIGRLDSATSLNFEKSLQNLFEKTDSHVVINLSALQYISSAGLRIILIAAKSAKQTNGRLVLFGLQPRIREIFEISGLLKILEVVDDRAAAFLLR
jgi:anti-anti-sigma factor